MIKAGGRCTDCMHTDKEKRTAEAALFFLFFFHLACAARPESGILKKKTDAGVCRERKDTVEETRTWAAPVSFDRAATFPEGTRLYIEDTLCRDGDWDRTVLGTIYRPMRIVAVTPKRMKIVLRDVMNPSRQTEWTRHTQTIAYLSLTEKMEEEDRMTREVWDTVTMIDDLTSPSGPDTKELAGRIRGLSLDERTALRKALRDLLAL